MQNKELQQEEKQFYKELYENRTILIQVSASDIADPNFEKAIQDIKALIADKIKIILVFGGENQTEASEKLNLNEDDVVTQIAKEQKEKIIEVIFATKTGGIKDINGRIVPTISDKKIPCILDGKHDDIKVEGEIYQKLLTAQEILEFVDKVAITDLGGIYDEITKLSGSGTLLFNLDKAKVAPLENSEIFDLQYAEKIESKEWLPRTKEKIDELKQNHSVLSINESPLGGYSLIEKEMQIYNETLEVLSFECWWADAKQNGIGLHLLKHAMQVAEEKGKHFAMFTKLDLNLLAEKLGLEQHKKIKSSSGATLWLKMS